MSTKQNPGLVSEPDTDLFERVVSQFVLVPHVDFLQQWAVRRHSAEGQVAELLAAVRCVFDQARTVRGQGTHAVVLNVPAVRDVDLRHVLSPRCYLHQEVIFHLQDTKVLK